MPRRTPHEPRLTRIVVWLAEPDDPGSHQRATWLAHRLDLPQVTELESSHGADRPEAALAVFADRLELWVLDEAGTLAAGKPLAADLAGLDVYSAAGQRPRQPLARAVGLPNWPRGSGPRVLDATAGWGEDAWLLAALGCHVIAVERQPIVFALLEDALRQMSTMRPSIAERIRPVWGDAIEVMQRWIPDGVLPWPDVVYLDPMFSAPRKTAERRPMRVLRALAGSDPDAAQLVETALAIAPRVVVKRPRHATPLVSHPTVHVVEAKALRFDVYHRPR